MRRVELEPIGLTEQGQRYRVTYTGEILAEGRRNSIFDACRALLARGIIGRLEVWRKGKPGADMRLDIERGARFAIKETATESLRIVTWEPWRPNTGRSCCVSYRRVQPPADADETQHSEIGRPYLAIGALRSAFSGLRTQLFSKRTD